MTKPLIRRTGSAIHSVELMTMNMIDQTTHEQFQRDGFVVIPNALEGEDLRKVQEAAERAEKLWRSDTSLLGARSNVLEQVQTPIEYDEAILELLWHPSTFPLVRSFLGEDVMMIDNDFFITPPHTPKTHAGWHHDVGMPRIYHPESLLMVKVFFLLTDVNDNSGGTAMVPGSHRLPLEHQFPKVNEPKDMPGCIQMTGKAGSAYIFNGRIYHCAVNNESDHPRKVLIFNYGHFWMKMWAGYEPSGRLLREAEASGDPVRKQLLGIGEAYSQRLSTNA